VSTPDYELILASGRGGESTRRAGRFGDSRGKFLLFVRDALWYNGRVMAARFTWKESEIT